MAATDRNTLNDTQYVDNDVKQAHRDEKGRLSNPGPEYDRVLSVFTKIMKDEVAAKKFTEALYRISRVTGTYVLTLLESLDTTDVMTLNTSMAYYLNNINSPATMYGVQKTVVPNFYVGRSVLK